ARAEVRLQRPNSLSSGSQTVPDDRTAAEKQFDEIGSSLPLHTAGTVHNYLVRVRDTVALKHTLADLAGVGINPSDVWDEALPGFGVALDDSGAERLRADDDVVDIELDQTVTASADQANPPWGLDRIDQRLLPLNSTYSSSASGAGVTAYVIDTGIWL